MKTAVRRAPRPARDLHETGTRPARDRHQPAQYRPRPHAQEAIDPDDPDDDDAGATGGDDDDDGVANGGREQEQRRTNPATNSPDVDYGAVPGSHQPLPSPSSEPPTIV